MKLCVIYTIWDDWDWLSLSLDTIWPAVDGAIIVYSDTSNFGEQSPPPERIGQRRFNNALLYDQLWLENWEPDLKRSARENETQKRNFGLKMAQEKGFTHFLMADADEFYHPETIERGKVEIGNDAGLVCRCKTYFRSPTLTIGHDTTLVTFIHKITPGLRFEMNQNYPFGWTDMDGVPFTPKKRIRIDPTRQLNITSGVKWFDGDMHHFSWIRKDVKKKVRNSTAKVNLERSTIFADYCKAKPGYFCQFYGKRLEACENIFHLPEIIDESLSV
jgi:hypothetical protein